MVKVLDPPKKLPHHPLNGLYTRTGLLSLDLLRPARHEPNILAAPSPSGERWSPLDPRAF